MTVYIAGTGVICSAGYGTDVGFSAVRSGLDYLKPFLPAELHSPVIPLCATIECDLDLLAGREGLFRSLALATVATDEAMSPLADTGGMRIGVVAATTVGGISQTEKAYRLYRHDTSAVTSLAIDSAVHEPSVLSADLCRRIGGCGFHTVSTACSSGLHAAGLAKRLIEREYYDACLAVGADAHSITTIKGFGSLTLLDPSGCRPFDKNRAGISLGEGAGALLLVSEKAVERCSRPPRAVFRGWGASSDCYHMTAPHPDGNGARAAIEAALTEAEISPDTIDCIVSHGTGTPDNDKAEIATLKSLFSPLPPFCSMKRTLGHTLAASGILETALAVEMMHESFIPPTAGFSEIDEQIGVAPATSHTRSIRHILKNAFGFGGNNAAVIISAVDGAE